MSRHFPNWLQAYVEHTEHSEAPTNIHFFSGISAISSALGRKVWVDMGYFKWYPNFYIIIVAKPGIATKSTSIGIATDILREVPGVHLGPSSITWQALIQHMGGVAEQVEIDGELHTISASTFVASELGTLIDFTNREMIDVLVDLWDGKSGAWEKMTKMKGMESIVNPWISLLAGVTPAWLASNVPESAVGGGFTSRCIFVYAERKRHVVAYPHLYIPKDFGTTRQKLIEDLEQISLIKGEYKLTAEALDYGTYWYNKLWEATPDHLQGDRYQGYLARKQTHMHKTMMILAASKREQPIITLEDFQEAETLFTSAEKDMFVALSSIGKSNSAVAVDELVAFVERRGRVSMEDASMIVLRNAHVNDVGALINMAVQTRRLNLMQTGTAQSLIPAQKSDESA